MQRHVQTKSCSHHTGRKMFKWTGVRNSELGVSDILNLKKKKYLYNLEIVGGKRPCNLFFFFYPLLSELCWPEEAFLRGLTGKAMMSVFLFIVHCLQRCSSLIKDWGKLE